MKATVKGHILALITIICWGTTFISTKILLADFSPLEILMTRFAIGLTILYIVRPQPLKMKREEHRLYLVLAGLSGITLYYLMENVALTYTLASNVSIITATAPFFAAILSYFSLKKQRLSASFFLGFVIAMSGVILISWESKNMQFNPLGDMLALGASAVWAVYAVLMKKICSFGYDMITATREIFLYGVILMLPALFFLNFNIDLIYLIEPVNLFNMLYLGIGASAACFLTWNFATKYLGVIRTTAYIYAIPAITLITAHFILSEPITLAKLTGMALAVIGLALSQK